MPVVDNTKQERMHIRVDARSKRLLEQAASHEHKSLSEFVLGRALSAAEEVVREHESLVLAEEDWAPFLDALEHPPEANAKLREAFAEHRRRTER